MGADTMEAMRVCGIVDVAQRTGVELCPFEHAEFDMYKIDRPISFNEFPVPRPVRDADVYIGLPKMKVHVHTTFTGAMKLQFGNLPDYDWMVRCHRDDIYQKIVNLTRAANPKWFVMDSLYACQGNGPFSPYSDDLIKDFNTICGGPDPVAVDTPVVDWGPRYRKSPTPPRRMVFPVPNTSQAMPNRGDLNKPRFGKRQSECSGRFRATRCQAGRRLRCWCT